MIWAGTQVLHMAVGRPHFTHRSQSLRFSLAADLGVLNLSHTVLISCLVSMLERRKPGIGHQLLGEQSLENHFERAAVFDHLFFLRHLALEQGH